MAGSKLRTVVESPEFAAQRKRIAPYIRQWDRFWFGLDWVLANNPEAGEQVFGLPLWVITTEPSPSGMPRLRIAYSFDDDTVTLLGIEVDAGGAPR